MPSLVWSTATLLLLLLPGFFFFVGLYASERFSRDVTPRNALAALSGTVLISFLVHCLLTRLVGLASIYIKWDAVLDTIQLPPPSAPNGRITWELAWLFERNVGAIVAYLFTSSGIGAGVGWMVGRLVAHGYFPWLQQHTWLHPYLRPGETKVVSYTHVLTDIGHAGQQVLYRGRLKAVYMNPDGTFANLVLAATEQRFLYLTGAYPRTGPVRAIGGANDDVEGPQPRSREEMLFGLFPSRIEEADPGQGAVMAIPGALIKDVVFQGVFEVKGLEDIGEEIAIVEDSIHGPSGELAAMESWLTADAQAGTSHPMEPKRADDVPSVRDETVAVPDTGAPPTAPSLDDLQAEEVLTSGASGSFGLTGLEGPVDNLLQSPGITRASIAEAQRRLGGLGFYEGAVDGVVGSATRAAARRFQKEQELPADGVPGPRTLAILRLKTDDPTPDP